MSCDSAAYPTASNHDPHSRIDRRFAALKQEGRRRFIAFVTAGDPDYATSEKILTACPPPAPT